MKRILLACLVLLALAGVTSAVPYPYKDYDLPTTGDLAAIEQEVRGKYTVYAGSETGSFSLTPPLPPPLYFNSIISVNIIMCNVQ